MLIKEIMQQPIIQIKPNASIEDAMQKMLTKRVTSLLIEEKAIITRKDIINQVIALNHDPKKTMVSQVMSQPLLTIPAATSHDKCAKIMKKTGLKHLPLTEENKIIGIITSSEIMKAEWGKNLDES